MNKKFLFIIFILVSMITIPAFALQWGVFDDYKININNYGMIKFINKTPIKYYLTNTSNPADNTNDTEQALAAQLEQELNYKRFLQNAFDTWPKETKRIIKESGRTQEFKDIGDYLNSFQLVEIEDKNKADLIIEFATDENIAKICGEAGGCYFQSTHELFLPDPYLSKSQEIQDKQFAVLIHELGHYLGFTDQYQNLQNNDLEHSTNDRFLDASSVMAASYETNLQCDDADGFINSIDVTLAIKNNGKFSKRAHEGWASLCNGKEIPGRQGQHYQKTFYKEARVMNKEDYEVKGNPQKRDACIYSYDANGNISKMKCPEPFNFYGRDFIYKEDVPQKAINEDSRCSFYYSNKNGEKIVITYDARPLLALKDFFSEKKEIDNKEVWTITPGYFIKNFESEGYVYIDSQKCQIHNYAPNTDFKFYDLTFNNNQLEKNFSYTFFTNSLRPVPITINKQVNSQDPVCSFKMCDKKILKEIGFNKCVNIFENDDITQELANYAGIEYEEFVEQAEQSCKENLSSFVINNSEALCDYFRIIDKYFKTLKVNNKIVSYNAVPELRRKK